MTDSKTTTAKPEPGVRPRTVVAAVVAVVASGLFAVIASLTLYGEHGFLTTQFNKQILTTKQITAATNTAAGAFDPSKKNNNAGKVSDKLKTNLAAAANGDSKAVASSDVTDQASKASTAAKSATNSTALRSAVQSNLTKLQKKERAAAKSAISTTPTQQLIRAFLLLVICGLLGFGAWRGRYWARWAIFGLWALSSFMGITVAGIGTLLGVFSSSTQLPIPFGIALGLCSLSMLVAVVLVFLPPSARYFALSRPAPRPGQPQRRGLFASRLAPAPTPAANRGVSLDKSSSATPERQRTKKRVSTANEQAVARGAELARSRAKASKSRRSGES